MSQTDIRQQIAQRRIKEFERKFGRNTLHLAYHAALPVALNSELLHLLRINFFLNPPQWLPYMAEIELLLSPLCQEIGDELYEIDRTVRDELLKGLVIEYEHERLREVAALLWQYTEYRTPWAIRLERAQQLIALNVLAPERAEQWLEEAERYLGGVATEEREWVMAMRQEVENVRQLILKPERAEQSLQEAEKYLGGAATEERESVMATRQEVENVRQLQIKNLPLKQIINGCQRRIEERCFELFRRAFDEKNEEAKTAVYHQYRRLIFDWAHKSLAGYPVTEQDIEDITSQATIKFFRHLSRISVVESYEHVAQMLGYCKKCVRIAAIDFTRKAMRAKRNQDEWIDRVLEGRISSPEKEVEQERLHQQINDLMEKDLDEEEMLYVQLKFRHGFTPREMVEMYPEIFPNPREVYKIWDRVKKRLKPFFKLHLK